MKGKLTDTAIKNATPNPETGKPVKMSDGGGLYLLVNDAGKYWRYAYRYDGKQKDLALGVYPIVRLAEARKLHEKAKQWLAQGIDPKAGKDREKLDAIKNSLNTFASVSDEWRGYESQHWSESHIRSVERILRKDVLPWMGNRPINEIDPPEVLQVLRRMEKRVGDSTRKARQIIGQVFRYGVHNGFCQRDPTADLKGAIKKQPQKHYPAITEPAKLGELLRAIERYNGEYVTQQALKFSTFVMVRPQNIRFVEWSEINLDTALWHVPACKLKMGQALKTANRPEDAQVVPLPKQAISILSDIKAVTGHFRYVFHSSRSKSGALSENTLNKAIASLGFGEVMKSHGMRTTAKTLLSEMGYRREVTEAALFHKESNQVVAAYNRAQYLEERREMLQVWADYLDALRDGAQVIPIKRAR